MMGQLIRYILLSFILTIPLAGQALTRADSLRSRLVEARSLRDSITILYNIYDASPKAMKGQTLDKIYKLAVSRPDYHAVYDVLKLSATHFEANDSMQQILISRAEKLPDSDEKRSTIAYLNIMSALYQAQSLPKDQREAKLSKYLAQYTDSKDFETHKRIEYLVQLCTYLRMSTEGELLTKYLRELQTLIDELPTRDIALKYRFYLQAAKSYLSSGLLTEGLEANKTLLNLIAELKKEYDAIGCSFRDYDKTAFLCYSRLLRCHDSLNSAEIEEYYTRIMQLINSDPTLKELSGHGKKPQIYYMMAKKRYHDAIPLIKEQLNSHNNNDEEQLYMADALRKAAEATGDKELLLEALDISNDMLRNRIESKSAASYKDLQTVYEVNDLKQANDDLLLANQQFAISRHNEQLTYGIISLAVLLTLLVIVFVMYRRKKKMATNLSRSNNMIANERDAIQLAKKDLMDASSKAKLASRIKNDFVKSMGHEIRTPLEFIVEYSGLIANCTDSDRRGYIKRFADVIALNSDRLLTLVNDVLDLPSLENAKGRVNITKSSAQRIGHKVIDIVKPHIKPGVELIFSNDGQSDVTIMTDTHRVEQVLIHLLTNAAKFTDKGSVTLDYTLTPESDRLTFTVTDTGIGIQEGHEEAIFSRDANHDTATHSKSLGLYISRMLAKMLGGSLTLDKSYRNGAKFSFSIPTQSNS